MAWQKWVRVENPGCDFDTWVKQVFKDTENFENDFQKCRKVARKGEFLLLDVEHKCDGSHSPRIVRVMTEKDNDGFWFCRKLAGFNDLDTPVEWLKRDDLTRESVFYQPDFDGDDFDYFIQRWIEHMRFARRVRNAKPGVKVKVRKRDSTVSVYQHVGDGMWQSVGGGVTFPGKWLLEGHYNGDIR